MIIEKINGYEIIKGFSTPVINPVETERKIIPLLNNSEETKVIQQKIKEISEKQKNALIILKEAVKLKARGDQKYKEKEREWQNYNNEIGKLQKEILPLKKPFQEKRNQLIKDNAIYFQPKVGENIIDESTYNSLIEKNPGQYGKLCSDGTIISDYRNEICYLKIDNRWSKVSFQLGEDIGNAILQKDLTPEQKQEIEDQAESERISALSASNRLKEKQVMINSLAYQANGKRGKLEIQGDKNALSKAKTWYNEQMVIIDEKYT